MVLLLNQHKSIYTQKDIKQNLVTLDHVLLSITAIARRTGKGPAEFTYSLK